MDTLNEYENYLSTNCLDDYLRIIKRTKPATKEENKELFLRYKNGEENVRDIIVQKNLSLVASLALKSGRNLSSEEKLEYIQSGVIGLIEAIDTFDVSLGLAFSTHAEYRIQMRINRYLYNNRRLIRRPEYIEVALSKYKRAIADFEKEGKPLPSREKMCSIIGVTESILEKVENDYKLDATSLDTPVSDDKDSDDLSDLIGDEDHSYDNLLDKMVIEEITKTLKMNLSPYEYYVIYYRMLSSEVKTLVEIADCLGITREAVRLTEERTKIKIRSMYDVSDHTLKRHLVEEIKKKYPFNSIKTTPCPIDNYTMYFYLKDHFSLKDQIILREILLGNLVFDSKRVAMELKESVKYVEEKALEIEQLIKSAEKSISYKIYHDYLIKEYKNKLYRLDLDSDINENIDIRKIISDYWKSRSFDEVLELADSFKMPYSKDLLELLNRFYGFAPKRKVKFNKESLERDVNYNLYGFTFHDIPASTLYPTFLKNQSKFTNRQRNYLNQYVFKKGKNSEPLTELATSRRDSSIDKLILMHYRIEDYKNDNFDSEKYLSIRTQCIDELDGRGIKLLDLYYGINGKPLTIKEIASNLNEREDEVEKDFRRNRYNAIRIYLGTTQYSYEKDRKIYSEVLLDEEFSLKSPHFEVSKMFFLDGKSYEEIANTFKAKPKLSQRRVAELIKYSCSAMDYYRFGITSTQKKYSKEFLLSVLNKTKFDDDTREVLLVYIDNRSAVKTANKLNRDLEEIRKIIKKLNYVADKEAIDEVNITVEDVEEAVMEHESTNVLPEREKFILSLSYGLNNVYNPTGKKRYPIVIAEMLGVKHNIGSLIRIAKEHVAAHKIGLLKTSIDFIDRNTLEEILQNPRLPLSEDDREIIINAYGLYDTKYYSINDLAKKCGVEAPVVRRRLYKGIINIKKYLNKEIEGKVLFDVDIEPYLKYFILEDREILTMLYRDNIPEQEIAQHYGLSHHQFNSLMQKIRMHLHDLRNNIASGIDFDYFWSNADAIDLPFCGNQQLGMDLCFLYYEKRINQSDIIKYYHPELKDSTVSELIRSFTIAVIKHQHGIRKANEYSYDEVAEYYENHKDEMGLVGTKQFGRFFRKINKNGPSTRLHPNRFITYELIKEKQPDYFRLDNTDGEQVRTILGNHGKSMSKKNVEILESLFGVTHANILSNEDWNKLIDFLGSIMLLEKKANQIKSEDNSNNHRLKKKKD